ncbi:MAG: glycosyltransferase [Ignavibacteriaceae bacterium]|nr:glycosyltransferase [Ignavibacteriaceae bacterium]
MAKKKIVILGPAPPYRGGNSLFVSHLFKVLKTDFEVVIYNYELLYPSFLFPGTTQYDESKKTIIEVSGKRIVNSINPINWVTTAISLKKEKADLIVFDWWHPFFSFCHFSISFLLKKFYKNKILFITENIRSHEDSFIEGILTKIGLRNAASFLALSNIVENGLKELSAGKRIYRSELPIYDCYQMDEYKRQDIRKGLGYETQDKVLLFFGYIRHYKGLDILLNAMPSLIEYDKSIKLLVVGEFYQDSDKYFGHVKELNISGNVQFIAKYVPNEDVGNYYSAADLVVLPYRSATQSGILNIAYGFTKPVLVTNVGGLGEFVEQEKTGIIINPDSPDEILEGVKTFFRLTESVDFENNIRNFVASPKFNNLPEVFSQIINDSEK